MQAPRHFLRAALPLVVVVVGATAVVANVLDGEVPAAPTERALAPSTTGDGQASALRRRLAVELPRGAFPNRHNTGVPPGVRLRPYQGACVVTEDHTVIDARTVDCDLTIRAAHVLISRSKINGNISSGTDRRTGFSFTLLRSTVNASPRGARQVTAVGEVHFTVIRSNVYGGNRGGDCWYVCRIVSSYFHGQDTDRSGNWHESGIRMGEKSVIRGNTIACDAPDVPPDAGCSAPLTGYGDFGPVQDNLIERNLFKATPGGTCAYGGSTAGKPYSGAARAIRFTGNVFERGKSGHCGHWFAISDFDPSAPENVWKHNLWDSGGAVRP